MSDLSYTIRPIKEEDRGYVLTSMREGVKQNPSYDRTPWGYMKATIGVELSRIVNDETTKILGAYNTVDDTLLGWICVTPGKRVDTCHWCYTRFQRGSELLRRRGIMLALIEEGITGKRFVYTLRARRCSGDETLANGDKAKSLDTILAEQLLARGISATHVPLREWLS